jgi:hypothetical protein
VTRTTWSSVRGVVLVEEIDRHLVRRDERERDSRPTPRSPGGRGFGHRDRPRPRAGRYLVTNWLLRIFESLLVWVAVGLVLVALADLLRRLTRWRWEARASQVSLSLLTAAAVGQACLDN